MALSFTQIRERKLVQWVVAYAAGAWVLLQIVDVLAETFTWNPAVERIVTVLLAVGFAAILVLAWYHGEQGRQNVTGVELLMLGGILLVAGAAVVAVSRGGSAGEEPGATTPEAQEVLEEGEAPDVPEASVAVLAFANMSGDPESSWFSEGISEEILNAVAQIPGLFVAARTSSFALSNRELQAGEIGRILGVANVLEGSVRRDGDQVRITAQLIDASTGFHRWSANYDFVEAAMFTIQDSIAHMVASRLELDLAPDAAPAGRNQTQIAAAHDFYLRGNNGIASGDEDGLKSALQHFDAALALDPGYALAWAGKSLAYAALADAYMAPAEAYPLALVAADSALRLAPDLAEALATRGSVRLVFSWDLDAAGADILRASELNPNYWLVHTSLFWYRASRGDLATACDPARRGARMDPFNPLAWEFLIWCSVAIGDWEGAVAQYERQLEADPGFTYVYSAVGIAYTALGMDEEAERAIARYEQIADRPTVSRVVYLVAKGRVPEAERVVLDLEQAENVPPELVAQAWETLGNRDRALEWLERGMETRSGFAVLLPMLRDMESVMRSTEYASLARRYGLPAATVR
ncbi:MAG: hypothetical protein ACC682_15660 [Gemmatimonadota bacterium]